MERPSPSAPSIHRWLAAVGTRDPDVVTALYDEDATFLPTFSGQLERGKPGVRRYFATFLEKRPQGEVIRENVQELGDGLILCSGLCDFHLIDGERRETVTSRFTLVWLRKNDDWRIVHHHSSLRPRG